MDFLELAHNLKDKVLHDHKDKIAIIAIYGSYAWAKPTSRSDLDMFAIIDDNSTKFNENFIYNSRSIDFWSITWATAHSMARNQSKESPWCVGAYLLTASKIIYSRSPEDLARFKQFKELIVLDEISVINSLQSLFKDLLFYSKRIEGFLPDIDLLTIRWVLWNYINTSVNIISLLNEKYLKSNWGSNIKEITDDLEYYPKNFQERILFLSHLNNKQNIVNTLNELSKDIEKLIQSKISSLILKKEQNLEERLAEEYIGIIEYVNKAKSACDEKNIIKLSYVVTELQSWLNELVALIKLRKRLNLTVLNNAVETNDIYLREYHLPDFVSSVSKMDFEKVFKDILMFEQKTKEIFTKLNVPIKEFRNEAELVEYLRV